MKKTPRLHIPRFRKRRPPGTAPGTLSVDPAAPKPVITVIAYGPESMDGACVDRIADLAEYVERWSMVWVNVDGLGDAELLAEIGRVFQVHPLAMEDVVNLHQRAKVEPYENHLFIVARMVNHEQRLGTEQISMVVGEGFVLTFQERQGDVFDMVRRRLREGRKLLRSAGAGYLAYALIDALIDAYFPALESYGDRIEELELEVTARPTQSIMIRIHALRRELAALRRSLWPHREAISTLTREDSPYISAETRIYLRDCYDHVIQLVDMVETYRELASGLLDVYLTSVSNRMNEVMKVLTIFAAVFIPLTFIAGLYGMNFEHMPELGWRWAYPTLLGTMVAVAIGMLVYFRRMGWLGRHDDDRRDSNDGAP